MSALKKTLRILIAGISITSGFISGRICDWVISGGIPRERADGLHIHKSIPIV